MKKALHLGAVVVTFFVLAGVHFLVQLGRKFKNAVFTLVYLVVQCRTKAAGPTTEEGNNHAQQDEERMFVAFNRFHTMRN